MTIEVFNGAGEYLELEARRGATLGPIPHLVVQDDGLDTPYDLSSYTFRGVVRSYANPSFSVEFDFDTSRADEGVYTFGLSDEKTALLSAGDKAFSSKSRHYWQTEMQDPAGRIIPLYYGELRVHPDMNTVL